MPLDGVALSGVLNEISLRVLDGRLDKISQPESDEIILHLRGRGENVKLLLSANAQSPRLHFTVAPKTNPLQAPMFCMILRKHLSGGRVVNILQPDFERIAEIHIESLNEMGDRSVKRLLIEIMGKHSNIILIDDKGVILDAARHISHSTSSVREVLPGKAYERPPSGKANPLLADLESFTDTLLIEGTQKIQSALYKSFNGISPVLASEICVRAGISPDGGCAEVLSGEKKASALFQAFAQIFDCVRNGAYEYGIYLDEKGKASDFYVLPLALYGAKTFEAYASPSEMLEAYYSRRDAEYRTAQKTADLRKLVNGHIERCVKKKILHERTLAEVSGRDKLREYGEMLTAYIHLIEKGAPNYRAQSFYDGTEIEIPLDETLTAAENAQAYFKKYNKQKRTYAALREQIKANDEDLAYLESVSASLQTVSDEGDVAEIRAELAGQGFVAARSGKKAAQAAKQRKSKPLRFVSPDGYEIYVGKNNLQNDELTLRSARAGDIWMHTKDIAGSHVIVKTNGGELPPDTTLSHAANLAAYYSKARGSSQVQVDYVQRKHVRKPNGAKPGFVIYDHHHTIFVTPEEPDERD